MGEQVMDARPGSDRIQTVTSGTFNSLVLEGKGRIAVEFMSYGCAHCRVIEPVLAKVAEMVKREETILRLNVAVEPDLASDYEIRSTPTFVMFQDGAEVGRVEGPNPTIPAVMNALTQAFAAREGG